ncbi:MAG: zinc dependent phospholipase C family protein [Candidatus Bathyarchaeota archaeon]
MKKFKIVFSILILFALLFFTVNVEKANAWGPCTHIYFTEKVLKLAGNTTLTNIIMKPGMKSWFLTGMMYPDVTVIYYYSEWKSYSATHAWTFQKELWRQACEANDDRAKAFALGVGVHLIQDAVSHNMWIPEKIRNTFVQNNIIHPLVEGLLEARLIAEDPLVEAMSYSSFAMWNVPFEGNDYFWSSEKGGWLTPVEWADKVLGRTVANSFSDEASLFNGILSGGKFYTEGFVIPQAGGWWSFYKAFSDFIKNFVSTEDANKYIDIAIQCTVEWFKSGQGDNPQAFIGQTDPTGYENLKQADSFVVNFTVISIIVCIFIILLYNYRKHKRS